MEQEIVARGEDEAEEGASAASPQEILMFLVRAAQRHRWFGVWVGLAVLVVGIAVAFVIPPRYDAEGRILANSSIAVAPTLTPGRAQELREPFAGATEQIMQKSNLVRVVEEAGLVQWFRTHRTFPQRTKDSVFALFMEPLSDEKLKTVLAETLAARMYTFHSDRLLTIHVGWNDPYMVQKLAQLVQKSYLEMRRNEELAIISAAIAITEDEVKRAAEAIDSALEQLMQVREKARRVALGSALGGASATRGAIPARPGGRAVAGPGVASASAGSSDDSATPDTKLTARLADVRRRAQDIETPWQRRLAELKFQLNDLRGTYGPEHPTVIQQQTKIAEASAPPPELTQLKELERGLIAQLESAAKTATSPGTSAENGGVAPRRVGTPSTQQTSGGGTARLVAAGAGLLIAEKDDDPVVAPAKASLASAIQRYSEVTKRLDAARLDLTSSQVALQYRFSVVAEPELPRGPSKPLRTIAILGAIGAALVLGFVAGGARDLLSGRVYEPWQVRNMGLTVLGVVEDDGRRAHATARG